MQQRFKHYIPLAKSIQSRGGRLILVGGCVRDFMMGLPAAEDVDGEVFGLDVPALLEVLEPFGPVHKVGSSFGIFKLMHPPIDLALPRLDKKTGTGHRGFEVVVDPHMPFARAVERRDFRINSLGYDILENRLLDPLNGVADLNQKILVATNPVCFEEDPLRVLRLVQFAARFNFDIDPATFNMARKVDLRELSAERIQLELKKILTLAPTPSRAFYLLDEMGKLDVFPEVKALQNVPQNAVYHPEGDVLTHTMMVIDWAAQHPPCDDRYMLMLALLAHDFGKPATTFLGPSGLYSAKGHEAAGVKPAFDFMKRLRLPDRMIKQVQALVRYHLEPQIFPKTNQPLSAYRRLIYALEKADVTADQLAYVSRADHMGRTTDEALSGLCPAVDQFTYNIRAAILEDPDFRQDKVRGEDLMDLGMDPGAKMGEVLRKCRDLQFEEPEISKDDLIQRACETN